jgi:hypothetical protein
LSIARARRPVKGVRHTWVLCTLVVLAARNLNRGLCVRDEVRMCLKCERKQAHTLNS